MIMSEGLIGLRQYGQVLPANGPAGTGFTGLAAESSTPPPSLRPQLLQNRESSGFVAPQSGQYKIRPLSG